MKGFGSVLWFSRYSMVDHFISSTEALYQKSARRGIKSDAVRPLKWRRLRYACIAPCSRHKRSMMATATGYGPRFSPFARILREWKQSAVGIEAPPAPDRSWIARRDVVTARFWASRQSRKSLPSTPVRESSGVSRLTGYRSSLSWRSSRLSRLSSSPRRSAPPRRIGGHCHGHRTEDHPRQVRLDARRP
jgi:hypothetical protein